MSMRSVNLKNANRLLPFLLSYLLLIQAAIPIQAHTNWVADNDGIIVLICTWQGLQEVVLDVDQESPIQSDEHRAPACVFSQLLGATIVPVALAAPFTLFQLTSIHVDRGSDLTNLSRPDRQTIRAPPIS